MTHDLQTLITALFPPSCAIRLTEVIMEQAAVRLQLTATALTAACPRCERRIFKERLPELVAGYARKPGRLRTVLQAIGVDLGGNAGARLAARLRLPTSPATLLRLVRTAPAPQPPALQAVDRFHLAHNLCQVSEAS